MIKQKFKEVNIVSKAFSKSDYLHTLDWLIAFFPCAFSRKPKEIKPLKIGILEDIYAFYAQLKHPEVTKVDIKQAIQHYSNATIYLACQQENVARVDLYGQEVDLVNHEQAKYAALRFEQKQQRIQKIKEE
ncbi:MAG: ProP effector [Bacteroidota bacterium]|nr:ProP effector [Bacteroidota bacterium]